MKKTVLHLIDTLYPAGAETVAVSIAGLLARSDRYEPMVCATRTGGELESFLVERRIRCLVLGRRSKLHVHKMRPLWDALRDANVAIIHAHGPGSGVWGVLAGRTRRVPLVAHVHGGGPLVRWRDTVDAMVSRLSRRVIAVSEFERQRLMRHGVPGDRVVAIPNGIDVERFNVGRDPKRKVGFGIDPETPVVGICAALRPEKNHEMFLQAAALVREGCDATFMIVGGGTRQAELEARARTLGIAERCIFTGTVTNVPQVMSIFDVGVLSSDNEGLPLTLLEYMASSLPVVATDIAAIPEAVEEGSNGFLVARGDAAALARRIADLLADRERSRRMGEEGRRIAEARFSHAVMAGHIQQVYDDVLGHQNHETKHSVEG